MTLAIQSIIPNSIAAQHGLQVGDLIININGHAIHDFIDLQFFSSEPVIQIEYQSGTTMKNIRIEQDYRHPLGIEPIPHKCKVCHNHCIFCFIEQMPPGQRKSLYLKDDDYLFSFVFGNFITLTNLEDKDFERIVEQRLSPLYISIHTTNSDLRRRMMGYRKEMDIMQRLRYMSERGIDFHAQIVLVPGWNDGDELRNTLRELTTPDLNILSIGIVPVGLTKYRENLTPITPFTVDTARAVLQIAKEVGQELDDNFIFCADELYNLANKPIPSAEYYGDFPQIENGIGMLRLLLENWEGNKKNFLKEIKRLKKRLVLITATSATPYLTQIAEEINTMAGKELARVCTIKNHFMGTSVTVAGLLTYQDIIEQTLLAEDELPAMPASIFNTDSLTLDNIHRDAFKEHWQRDILLIDELFQDWELI